MEKSPKNRDICYTKCLFYWKFIQTPRIFGIFDLKHTVERLLQAEYTENSGYSMRFFRKIGKFTIIGEKLGLKTNKFRRKLRKIGFFAKTVDVLKINCSTNSCTSHNCRKHRKIRKNRDSTQYNKIGEKFSPIITKIWHFLKCHNNCISKSINCSHIKISKEQLTAHTPIVKRITVSVTNTHLSSSNALLYQLVLNTHKILKQLKSVDIANCNKNEYNGSFFSY